MHKECGRLFDNCFSGSLPKRMNILQGGACDGLHTRGRGFAAGIDRTVTTICGRRRSLSLRRRKERKHGGKGPAQRQNLQKGMREYIRSICQADRLRNWQRSIFWRKRVSSVLYGRSAKSYRLQFLNALSISDSSSAENFRNSFGVIPVIWRN